MARRTLNVPAEALEKYEEFHRHAPKQVGKFASEFKIPERVARAGASKWVTYRSDKVDPETLRRPRKPINYIHEHNAGVVTYLTFAARNSAEIPLSFTTSTEKGRDGTEYVKVNAFTAYEGRKVIVGSATFSKLSGNRLYPETTQVFKKWQRQGIGTRIYQTAEHDTGREIIASSAQTPAGAAFSSKFRSERAASVAVPAKFRDDDGALVLLGSCLGFKYDEQEVEGVAPLPDLYCTPDGKCLLVVQSRRTVLAMMWGGALGVFARGIDG